MLLEHADPGAQHAEIHNSPKCQAHNAASRTDGNATNLHRQELRLLALRLFQDDVHPLPGILVRLQLLQDALRCRSLQQRKSSSVGRPGSGTAVG